MCVCASTQLRPTLSNPTTVPQETPLTIGFSWQEHQNRLPFPPPGDLPDPETEPVSTAPPAPQADSLPLNYLGSPISTIDKTKFNIIFTKNFCLI